MRGDKVDAGPGLAAAPVEQIGRAGESGRQIRHLARIALPVASYRIAEAVVPLGPARREMPDLIAARPDIPGLGDQLDPGQHRVLAAAVEKTAALVETVRLARKDRRQIEAEPVIPHFLHPIAQAVGHHLQYTRMAEIERV